MIKDKNTILRLGLLLIVLCSIASCNTGSFDFLDTPFMEGESVGESEDGRVMVVLPVAGGTSSSSTRTTIDPDDLSSVRWSVGDQVALWADGVDSTDGNLTGEMFQLSSYSGTFDNANFSGSILPMSEGQTYTYCGFYPYTTSVSGKTVSYTLPSTQSGKYDGDLDFRVADCIDGGALTSDTFGSDFSLAFRSVTHAFKITIPEGYNFFGHSVNKMKITMPANVVGSCSLDISDSSATPSFSNGESVITLDFGDETIDEGDTVWAFINPTSGVTGDIKIRGISSDNDWSYEYIIPISDHTFGTGRITPINTEIGEQMPSTTIVVNISENNLGEDLTNINVTAPEGAIFSESGSNTATISGTTSFKLSYITGLYGDYFKNASLTLELESNQALIPSTAISMSSITEDEVNTFSRAVPYVLYEDFNTLSSSYNQDGYPGVGSYTYSTGDKDYYDLSNYGLTTKGWTATRGSSNGSKLSICCRSEASWDYDGRVNSPALSYLKDGAKIKVTYSYGGSYYARYSYVFGWGDYTDGKVTYQRGYFTGDDTDADDDIANCVGSDGVSISTSAIDVSTTRNSTQTYSTNQSGSFYVSNASSSTRLAWHVMADGIPATGNGNYCLYLENVVVQVVQ